VRSPFPNSLAICRFRGLPDLSEELLIVSWLGGTSSVRSGGFNEIYKDISYLSH
jgi:hypothetical protein